MVTFRAIHMKYILSRNPFAFISFLITSTTKRAMSSNVATSAGHPVSPSNLAPYISPRVLSIQSHTVHGYVGKEMHT